VLVVDRLTGGPRRGTDTAQVSGSYLLAAQTTPTRNAARVSYDRAAVHAVLDQALVCHVGFVVDGEPVVLPQLHARVDYQLYMHGSTGARALHAARVYVTVTLTDGLVPARSASPSINYRSVVAHGTAHLVDDDVQASAVGTRSVARMWCCAAQARKGGRRRRRRCDRRGSCRGRLAGSAAGRGRAVARRA